MFSFLKNIFKNIDWVLFSSVILVSLAGLITMNSFGSQTNFFDRQIVWLCLSILVFFTASCIDWRFLKNTKIVVGLFVLSVVLLASLFILGSVFKGAQSWFSVGSLSFQPSDPIKLVVILILAKYFSRRTSKSPTFVISSYPEFMS